MPKKRKQKASLFW